jgi:hypothetical protein
MVITQRSYSNSITFDFEPDALKYTRADSYGSHSFQVPYGNIGMDPQFTTERNGSLFNGAILLSAWGLAQTAHAMLHGDMTGLIFLFPGAACFLVHALTRTTITSLGSDAGEIALLMDEKHDTIMSEIRERRKKQLLDWYGNINFSNDPEEEIQKFEWLHSQHLISSAQLQRAISAIRNADGTVPEEYDEPIPPRQ